MYASENVEGTYYVQNKNSKLYLDIENGSAENGANIRQWDYNGSDAQKFKFVSVGDGHSFSQKAMFFNIFFHCKHPFFLK